MGDVNDSKTVKSQYSTSANLSTRISIHDKYSTNKTGFGNWIYSNYEITPGMKILELGCGTGSMWKGKDDLISSCSKIVLSDISEAMVDSAKATLGERDNIEYKVIDIREIPYEDDTFDAVIGNMMLYHVPDLNKGLTEVRRVLKKGGRFYSATYGEHGIMEYLSKVLSEYGVEDNVSRVFTLQNGREILQNSFSKVKRLDYIDSLAVTNIDDMVDYIYSLSGMTTLSSIPRDKIREILLANTVDGVLNVPKEYGMFISE